MATNREQIEFDSKLIKLLKFNYIPGKKVDSEKLTAMYIHDHRYDPRMKKFLESNYNQLALETALLNSSILTLGILTSKTLFEAIGKLSPNPWPKILNQHLSTNPAFLVKLEPFGLGHFDDIWRLTLNPIFKEFKTEESGADIPKDDAKKRFEDAEQKPRATPRAEPHRAGASAGAGSGSSFMPGFAKQSERADPKPAAPKREFSDFEKAMGRADYLDTRAHRDAMEERKQEQESKMKSLIKNYVNEGVDIYKPFGTKEEVEKMSNAAFKRKFAELANAPGEKNMELLTNAKEILQNPSYKAYYDRKVAEKALGKFRPG